MFYLYWHRTVHFEPDTHRPITYNTQEACTPYTAQQPSSPASKVPAPVVPDSGVVKEALDASHRANGDILIPQPPLGKVHHILLRYAVDDALDLGRVHPPPSGDDLATNVLGNGGGAVKGEEDGSLELGLCPLDLGLGDAGGETGPFPESEVDQVIDRRELVGNEVNTPETILC